MAVPQTTKLKSCSSRDRGDFAGGNGQKLDDRGRVQFFNHHHGSLLPIRDVRRETEPHIEVGAANYVKPCAQTDYRSFCLSPERYLFLTTVCRNCAAGKGRFINRRFVVGYIRRVMCFANHGRWSVFGPVRLVQFDAALEYGRLGLSSRKQRFAPAESRRLVKLLNARTNVRDRCVKEMLRIEELERAAGHSVIADEVCLDKKGECVLRNKCLRKRLARAER
jgi:hypothetical protein